MKTNWFKWFGYFGLYLLFLLVTNYHFKNWYEPVLLGASIALISHEKA